MSHADFLRSVFSAVLAISASAAVLPAQAQTSTPGGTLTCRPVEGFLQAQFTGTVTVSDFATAEHPEVTTKADFTVSTSRKVVEGPDDSPVVREITEQLSARDANAVTQYLAAGQFYAHEAVAIEVVSENQDGVKTFLRTIPQGPGLNSTLLHDGLPYRARCE